MKKGRIIAIFIIIVILALALGVAAAYSFSPSGKSSTTTSSSSSTSTFTSSNSNSCNRTISYNGQNYSECLMTVEQLEQLIQNPSNSFINDGNGTIYLYIGQNACTVWFYYLPNDTNVIEYLGMTGTQTCE